ncbi:MAG: DUF2252 family protein [Fimbriimonadaceae bacterium]
MDIVKSTAKYEKWVAKFIPVVVADLDFKHEQMRAGVFPFLRATFYRWVQTFAKHSGGYADTPQVLAVGDLHVENYGTWRDAEGRLIWGINDFDEAAYMPYTNDLSRLATSVQLAVTAGHLKLDIQAACDAILDGYRTCLNATGRPYVLEEDHGWLRHLATGVERAPDRFWQNMLAIHKLSTPPLEPGLAALKSALPHPVGRLALRARRAGLGSLGHPRYVTIVEHEGGMLAREAKLLAPSAVLWASKQASADPNDPLYRAIADTAVRCRDPFLALHDSWVVRRLAPVCSRIELSMMPEQREELKMVYAMGFELGNIHFASRQQVPQLLAHLRKQPKKWLRKSVEQMADLVAADFEAYRT